MRKKRSMWVKIALAMIISMSVILMIAGGIFFYSMKRVSDTLIGAMSEVESTAGSLSSSSLTEMTQTQLLQLASDKADIADTIFVDFKRAVGEIAQVTQGLYENPERYLPRKIDPPDAKKDGELSVQVLYDEQTDPEDPAVQEELALVGNIEDTIRSVNQNLPSIASTYFATETGFTVMADFIAASKFDENGAVMPLAAKERPWYKGASILETTYFTTPIVDVHTPQLVIVCGIPVYVDGELKGVAGSGMYLNAIDELVENINLNAGGNACIINQEGNVLFSTFDSGLLAVSEEGTSLRRVSNPQLKNVAMQAIAGKNEVGLISIDGAQYYVAYAPLRTVGWSILVLQKRDVVERPTQNLRQRLTQMMIDARQTSNDLVRRSRNAQILILLGTILFTLCVAMLLSRKIVRPIRQLTEEVERIDGDNLDFTLQLQTGDETETLAESFASLTGRMKDYIHDIAKITAEQERIDTELSMATRIQAAMLPNTFPPFPDRQEFDIYALMDPAREVGGDFYDFFLIDDDHLCMVIADVSGKGVPAALFMMVSKIIIQSCAMLGESAAEILEKTNEAICSNNEEEMFVTVWIGILEISTGKLTAANAGHEYPAIKKPDGTFELYKDKHGFVIGGFEGETYQEYEMTLAPGSKIFVYTDGVPEAKGDGSATNMFGTGRMLDALNADPDATPEQILANVRRAVDDFVQEAEQFDDLTMLCMEYRGAREEALQPGTEQKDRTGQPEARTETDGWLNVVNRGMPN